MTEPERLDEQLRLSFEGGAWHGPSVLEALGDVNAPEACRHPIANAHSIWDLVGHLAGTYGLVLRRLQGDGRQLSPEEDWPSLSPSTEEAWREAIRVLRALNDELRRAVRVFPAEKLDLPLVPEPTYTAYTQFIGVTQHNLYHAGQIVLLKKALRQAP